MATNIIILEDDDNDNDLHIIYDELEVDNVESSGATIVGKRNRAMTQSIHYLELPNSQLQGYALLHQGCSHVGLGLVQKSLELHRACNEAIIFVYGSSGSGKTETLNSLFGFPLIPIQDISHSTTTLHVNEYITTMRSDNWEISNLELGFIDMPGFGDTGGLNEDAINLTLIERFIRAHPHLGNKLYHCYPNIVLITINANQKRMDGFEGEMFKNLNRINVIDSTHPNVIILLTHVMSIPIKYFDQKIEEIKAYLSQLAWECLKVEVKITYIENHPDDYELIKEDNGWRLPDKIGTLQPNNVFNEMISLMVKNEDQITAEAIQTFSKCRETNMPTLARAIPRSKIKPCDIKRWQSTLLKKPVELITNEVTQSISNYERKEEFIEKDSLIPLMHALCKSNFCFIKDLAGNSINDICNELSYHYLTLNPIEKKVLIDLFKVIPLEHPQLTHIMGKSYSISENIILDESIFKEIDKYYISNGARIPIFMDIIEDESLVISCKIVSRESENKDIQDSKMFEFTVAQKKISLRLRLDSDLAKYMKDEFKEDVELLPKVSETGEMTDEILQKYREFSEKYGHFIVSQCNAGGFITGQITQTEELMARRMSTNSIRKHIAIHLTNLPKDVEIGRIRPLLVTEDLHQQNIILDTDVKFSGGRCPPCRNLRDLTDEIYSQWLTSLMASPIVIDPKKPTLEMYSIHHIVNLIGQMNKAKMIKDIYTTIFKEYANCQDDCTIMSNYENKIHMLPENIERWEQLSADHISNINRQHQTREIERNVMIERSAIAETEQATRDRPQVSTKISAAWDGFPPSSKIVRLNRNDEPETVEIRDIVEGDRVRCLGPKSLFEYIPVIEIIQDNEREIAYRVIHHKFGKLMIGDKTRVLSKRKIEKVMAEDLSLQDIIYYYNDTSRGKSLGYCHIRALSTKKEKGNYQLVLANQNAALVIDKIIVCGQEAGCFPGNALITLKGGDKIPISQLQLGQSVLSVDMKTNKLLYTKVYLWAHRQPHTVATFLRIVYQGGAAITLTHNHLLPTNTAADEHYTRQKMLPASQLKVGDIIYTTTATSSNRCATPVRVLSISTCTQTGYYAPLTNNSVIVVDGVVASVFSLPALPNSSLLAEEGKLTKHISLHTVAHHLFTPARVASKLGLSHTLNGLMDDEACIHKYCLVLIEVFKKLF